jgi:hypothetical protein
MKCKYCKKEIEGELKHLAYYSGSKPVYWQLCVACIRQMWLKYKADLKD